MMVELFDNIRRGGFASSWGKYISDPELARKELRVLCLNCNEIRQPISKPKETKPNLIVKRVGFSHADRQIIFENLLTL